MSKYFTTQFAGRDISIATDYVAGQADGAAFVTYGDTVVLVTAVSQKSRREGIDFLPLTVDYQEMTSAVGKIPGGFFKREGRPNEKEILTSRVIDRSIRPLFPKGYAHETQIIATVLSYDCDNASDVAAMLGASAALTMSDIPFNGPIASVRVGRIDNRFICNPTKSELEESDVDLFLTGRKIPSPDGGNDFDVNLVMVEGGANEVPEDVILEAFNVGLETMRSIISLQDRIRDEIGKVKRSFDAVAIDDEITIAVEEASNDPIRKAFSCPAKQERSEILRETREKILEKFVSEDVPPSVVESILEKTEKIVLRQSILAEKRRIDGRSVTDVRPITCEVGLLPRTHGSALFTRGETQALVVLTLGTSADEQRLDYISGEEMRTFILHYNFPPFSVGEARFLRGPGRREIGHGALARRALIPVLPSQDDFPYTIRIVSDILSSNGSSSMATVCGGSLSLMDAGVPITEAVAGVAMGLLKEGDDVVVLTDILGDEDHAGDMDFKVCGTKNGITALQMDIKVDGLTREILQMALSQAREARLHILDKMNEKISRPKDDLSTYAPRITTITVNPDRIRDVIGTGGKTIRQIIADTGVSIDVEDDGSIMIASNDEASSRKAIEIIRSLTEEAEIGKIYQGTVKKVVDFGAFVEILPGTDGLVHISQLAPNRVRSVTDVVNEGDTVRVKVLDIDKTGRIKLSMKDATQDEAS